MVLKATYIALTVIMLIAIIYGGIYSINKSTEDTITRNRKKTILVFALLIWQLYIYIIAESGIIASYSFPPRFALLLILPSFIFTGVFISKNRNKKWIQKIPQHWLIYIQSFRIIVEVIFVFSVANGVLHKEASIEGYNYDMILGFSALIIGLLAFKLKVINTKYLIVWNYIGLGVLTTVIFVFMTSIYKPELYGATAPLMPIEGFKYPYVLVAGFLMPLAVFIHVLSIVQLKKVKQEL